ncbi:galactose-specific lectin nattectin-like isoform X2 [Ruditapes philippinarum]|nr:galactose-specific lectin nattectin-like isoform X2 [Ruditapes philippinarum]XP_060582299.1 galactose-specific lectin nattectin-like isoform X2 [Ruditapes philippinarum]
MRKFSFCFLFVVSPFVHSASLSTNNNKSLQAFLKNMIVEVKDRTPVGGSNEAENSLTHDETEVQDDETEVEVVPPGMALDCPSGWICHGTSCYHFSRDLESWMNAQMICQGFGGNLAEIENEKENRFLANKVKLLKGSYWIGGNDLANEGEWKWWHSNEDFRYTDWLPGEPNNHGGKENCVDFTTVRKASHQSTGWWDDQCQKSQLYICEKNLAR